MNCFKSVVSAITVGLLGVSYPHANAQAQEPSAQFLGSGHASQVSYVDTSVLMAIFIVAQDREAKSNCIRNWYFQRKSERVSEVVTGVSENPAYHPTAVILALIQQECGAL